MKLKANCAECGQEKILVHEYRNDLYDYRKNAYTHTRVYKTYRCGHCEIEHIDLEKAKNFKSLDGKKEAYAFQKEGVEFLQQANYNGLLGDAMGLGKTIQALLAMRTARLFPCLIIVRSATTVQWIHEAHEWFSDNPLALFPILTTKGFIPLGFQSYIISMDMLGKKGMAEKLKLLGIKMVCVDECHSFKDESSARTIALLKLIKENSIKHKIFLSGTPIKNRASEYFVTLNMLAPEYFPHMASFKRNWLEANEKGVYTRLNRYRIENFKNVISKWVLRREKRDVLTNLPPFQRNKQYIEIRDESLRNSYNQQLGLFESLMASNSNMGSFAILGELAKLRRVTGTAKIPDSIEYCKDFIESTEDDKLAIGIHHEGVRDALFYALTEFQPLKLSGEDSPIRKNQIIEEFKKPHRRVLVINTLAGGVGLNIQHCWNFLVHERQWSAADEEQFEGRFWRDGQKMPVWGNYLIAKGTIDQFFDELVEEKRKIFGETIGGWDLSGDSDSLRQLVDRTISSRI